MAYTQESTLKRQDILLNSKTKGYSRYKGGRHLKAIESNTNRCIYII